MQILEVKHFHKSYDPPEDKLYNIQHHVDYKNNQSGRPDVFQFILEDVGILDPMDDKSITW